MSIKICQVRSQWLIHFVFKLYAICFCFGYLSQWKLTFGRKDGNPSRTKSRDESSTSSKSQGDFSTLVSLIVGVMIKKGTKTRMKRRTSLENNINILKQLYWLLSKNFSFISERFLKKLLNICYGNASHTKRLEKNCNELISIGVWIEHYVHFLATCYTQQARSIMFDLFLPFIHDFLFLPHKLSLEIWLWTQNLKWNKTEFEEVASEFILIVFLYASLFTEL